MDGGLCAGEKEMGMIWVQRSKPSKERTERNLIARLNCPVCLSSMSSSALVQSFLVERNKLLQLSNGERLWPQRGIKLLQRSNEVIAS